MTLIRSMVDRLIRYAQKRPYGHIYHADGSLYMGRYWVLQTRFFWVKLHYIATPDYDRHMHDHPWSFVSVVLRGGYSERRPSTSGLRFDGMEPFTLTHRHAGSIAYRRFYDRHLIQSVAPDTWTLCISGPKRQSWGFYTENGFVQWRDYVSGHSEEGLSDGR